MVAMVFFNESRQTKFENTKGVIKSRNSKKNRQFNDQKKGDKRISNKIYTTEHTKLD